MWIVLVLRLAASRRPHAGYRRVQWQHAPPTTCVMSADHPVLQPPAWPAWLFSIRRGRVSTEPASCASQADQRADPRSGAAPMTWPTIRLPPLTAGPRAVVNRLRVAGRLGFGPLRDRPPYVYASPRFARTSASAADSCDTRSHVVSSPSIGGSTRCRRRDFGQCPGPVPAPACVVSNDRVRSPGEAQGRPLRPGATGEGKTGRVNTSEPPRMPRYGNSPRRVVLAGMIRSEPL